MTTHPLLMVGPMVCATLAEIKTNTRRLNGLDEINEEPDAYAGALSTGTSVWWFKRKIIRADGLDEKQVICPYGIPGDRLWVRETWRTGKNLDGLSPKQIGEKAIEAGYKKPWAPIQLLADDAITCNDDLEHFGGWGKTRVSIHMPRWASRITLEITDIRVQRLHDISIGDLLAEGVRLPTTTDGKPLLRVSGPHAPAAYLTLLGKKIDDCTGDDLLRAEWFALWESINGAGYWRLNPWVWALTFKRVNNLS